MIRIFYTPEDKVELLDDLKLEFNEKIANKALSKEIPKGLLWEGKTIKNALLENIFSPSPVDWYSGVLVQQENSFTPKNEEEKKFMMACRYLLKYINKIKF